jgi:HEAT repeat protein
VLLAFFSLPIRPALAQSGSDRAWSTLQAGIAEKDVTRRAGAIRVLGLLEGNPKAAELALNALKDEAPEVRASAIEALADMKAKSAVPRIQEVTKTDEEVSVVMAGGRSLIALGDPMGYGVYYAILTGERKSGGALLDDQKKMLKDPKKMAQFGFEQGIGFIPFAGVGLGAVKALTKDDTSPVMAAAARILAKDPDPKSGQALVEASQDSHWLIRVAAVDSLARRGDPGALGAIDPSLDDEKDIVRYTAAAAIIHLNGLLQKKK